MLFLDLFIDGLFIPGIKINPEYKNKYLHILAYATTVAESYKKVLIIQKHLMTWPCHFCLYGKQICAEAANFHQIAY